MHYLIHKSIYGISVFKRYLKNLYIKYKMEIQVLSIQKVKECQFSER